MYDGNYLAERLHAASIGYEDATFLNNHYTGKVVSYAISNRSRA